MNHIRNVLSFGWSYLRQYWARLGVALLFSFVFALSNGSFIWATRTLTERFSSETVVRKSAPSTAPFADTVKSFNQSVQRAVDPWLPRIGEPPTTRQIVGVLLFLPLLVLIRSAADYISNYSMGWVSERVVRDMRLDIMEKLSTLSLDFFN